MPRIKSATAAAKAGLRVAMLRYKDLPFGRRQYEGESDTEEEEAGAGAGDGEDAGAATEYKGIKYVTEHDVRDEIRKGKGFVVADLGTDGAIFTNRLDTKVQVMLERVRQAVVALIPFFAEADVKALKSQCAELPPHVRRTRSRKKKRAELKNTAIEAIKRARNQARDAATAGQVRWEDKLEWRVTNRGGAWRAIRGEARFAPRPQVDPPEGWGEGVRNAHKVLTAVRDIGLDKDMRDRDIARVNKVGEAVNFLLELVPCLHYNTDHTELRAPPVFRKVGAGINRTMLPYLRAQYGQVEHICAENCDENCVYRPHRRERLRQAGNRDGWEDMPSGNLEGPAFWALSLDFSAKALRKDASVDGHNMHRRYHRIGKVRSPLEKPRGYVAQPGQQHVADQLQALHSNCTTDPEKRRRILEIKLDTAVERVENEIGAGAGGKRKVDEDAAKARRWDGMLQLLVECVSRRGKLQVAYGDWAARHIKNLKGWSPRGPWATMISKHFVMYGQNHCFLVPEHWTSSASPCCSRKAEKTLGGWKQIRCPNCHRTYNRDLLATLNMMIYVVEAHLRGERRPPNISWDRED